MNKQRLILFGLVVLFGVTVLWSYRAMPRPKTVSTLTYQSGQQAKQVRALPAAVDKSARATDDGARLKLDLLESQSVPFKGYRRNIFKPIFIDEQKNVKQRAVAVKPPVKVVVPVPPPPSEQVVVPPEAAQLARFTFLGFLKKGTARTIFLANDKDILLVKKGDKVAGRYEATDISDQALTLTVTDTGDEIVIPLLENRPLAAAK